MILRVLITVRGILHLPSLYLLAERAVKTWSALATDSLRTSRGCFSSSSALATSLSTVVNNERSRYGEGSQPERRSLF